MYRSIAMDEFYQKEKSEKLVILDVREVDEYEKGHIDGAENIPLSNLEELAEKLDKSQEYYVICLAGGRSAKACEYLGDNGFDTINVMGGMSAWKGDIV